jgi:hypothetical protein
MKTVYRLFAVACLSFAGFSGCAASSSPTEASSSPAQQTTVIRYSAEDVAALGLGEFLHMDLTRPNTVYALTYKNPSDLDHVMVVRSNDKYILGERLPAKASSPSDALSDKEIVLSGDDPVPDAVEQVVCNCPCCQLVDGQQVCC